MCGRPPGDGDAERVGRRHMGNTREVFPVQIAEPLDGGSGHAVGKGAGYNGQENEWQTHIERFPPDCHAAVDVHVVLNTAGTVGGPGYPYQVRRAVRSCPWPSSP